MKDTAYQEWKNSASNVNQAGKTVALIIDEKYADEIPSGAVKKKAFSMIKLDADLSYRGIPQALNIGYDPVVEQFRLPYSRSND